MLLLAMALGVAPAHARPPAWQELDALALDDPQGGLDWSQQKLAKARAAQDVETQFWMLLGSARMATTLEDAQRSAGYLAEARRLLATWPGAGPMHRLWLGTTQALADVRLVPSVELMARVLSLRREAVPLGMPDLLCEIDSVELWALVDVGNNDDAWTTAEAIERCAAETGYLDLEVSAITQLGSLSGRVSGKVPAVGQAEDYFQRALSRLDKLPARFQRSLIEFELGGALNAARLPGSARDHFLRALALSQDLGDKAGVAAGQIRAGEMMLLMGDADSALEMARSALPLMEAQGNQLRLTAAHMLVLKAMTALKRPDVAAALEPARRADAANVPPARRAELAQAMAEALALLGQHARAYAELQRANQLRGQSLEGQRDTQMLRLQARYETARRDVETTELRRQTETAQLALQAREAGQRALWTALGAACLLLVGAVVMVVRGWRHRRQLAELALRDELTGLPNRRAIRAAAQAQIEQAQRWQGPCVLALIDIDHFKQVNDQHGHATGDAVLKALAKASAHVLRSHDRFGRLGGEEFLLVIPGSALADMPAVFDRLRSAFSAVEVLGLPVPHGVRFSMGAVDVGTEGESLDQLLDRADHALYEAKAAGRDQLVVRGPVSAPA